MPHSTPCRSVCFGITYSNISTVLLLHHKYHQSVQPLLWTTKTTTHSTLLHEQPCAPFLGRDRELNELLKVLDTDSETSEVRVVNIVGPTGIGETCLAVEIGHHLTDSEVTVGYIPQTPLDGTLRAQCLPHHS